MLAHVCSDPTPSNLSKSCGSKMSKRFLLAKAQNSFRVFNVCQTRFIVITRLGYAQRQIPSNLLPSLVR